MLEVKFVNEHSGSNLDAPIRSIAQYLTQPNRKLIIPPWQREYVWQVGENGEVGDLLSDLKEFIENGVGELEESKLETLLEIKYSDVFNAVQTLGKGDVGKVRKLFLDFQKNLYLPHKEYQRVS
jgi:uncharacterized protein with ParB-like and HNH nuclease domain